MTIKPQDFFGATPKTVLNKPFMQVQEKYATGTSVASVASTNPFRVFNTIVTNEISGATLSSGKVTLPAGTYYIEGYGTGYSIDGTRVILADDSGVLILLGDSHTSDAGLDVTVKPSVSGQFTLTETTTLKFKQYAESTNSSGLGHPSGNSEEELYAEFNIWQLDSTVETLVISDPTMALARPLFHAQDQKAEGTDGGSASLGENERDLNTVLTNEISGASLGPNRISLPAGTYYIEASSTAYALNECRNTVIGSVSGELLRSHSHWGAATNATAISPIASGKVTLTATENITLSTYVGSALATYGLGTQVTDGIEVYSDIKIWQLDALSQTPVLVNDKLYPLPSTTYVTGNMHGLEYAYTSSSTITVQPGICMDSTNNEVLSLSSAQVVTIGSTVNEVYSLFLCDDGVVRTDTDVDGSTLIQQDAFRWIGFVRNNSSSDLMDFRMASNILTFVSPLDSRIGTIASTYTQVDHSGMMPVSRVVGVVHGANGAVANVYISLDGVTEDSMMNPEAGSASWTNFYYTGQTIFRPVTTYFKYVSAQPYLCAHQMLLRR